MARLDWNINDNNKLNFRFTRAHSKDNSGPTSSVSPFMHQIFMMLELFPKDLVM